MAKLNELLSRCSKTFPFGQSFKSWDRKNENAELEGAEVDRLISVRPSPLQAKFSDLEYYTFIHFGMNTCTGAEWGTGKENPSQFNPKNLDTDQWARVIKESGSRGIILTAKHHDGFCLFPSAYTEHSVKNSPYKNGKGDVVKELSESCKKYGLLFGVYLSPWDMHEKTYATKEYDDYFVNQLTELCTNYGDIFAFWFDGAKGKDAPKFKYDFERYYKVIRSLQPGAAICNCGPDVRWIGNEAGKVRESEWSVIEGANVSVEKVMSESQQDKDEIPQGFDCCAKDLGSRAVLKNAENLIWSPGEADVSIHRGWFYNPRPLPKTAKELEKIYFRTVGGNALLLLNVPPSKNGVIEESDVKLLADFKKRVDSAFCEKLNFTVKTESGRDLTADLESGDNRAPLQKGDGVLTLALKEKKKIRTLVLREDITQSQRVEKFEVFFKAKNGYKAVCSGTTIGSKKIVRLSSPFLPETDEVIIAVTQSRSVPVIRSIELFA